MPNRIEENRRPRPEVFIVHKGEQEKRLEYVAEYCKPLYGSDVQVDYEANEERNRRATFEGGDIDFEVWVRADDPEHPTALENYYLLDNIPTGSISIDGQDTMVYESEHGYCDAGACGSPFTAFAMKRGDDFYIISFYNDVEMTEAEELIMSSFKFID